MYELLSRFEPGQLIGLVAVVGSMLCGLSAIVMGIWMEMRKADNAAKLKQFMLERGMSAEDIRTVLDAGSSTVQKGLAALHLTPRGAPAPRQS